MSLKVIGAGFGRTGTLSLKQALETLGFGPTHHMTELIGSGEQIEHWHRIAFGGEPRWDEVFADYQSTTDFPACSYWRELAEAFPEAKVVLTVRPADKWYDSASNTIRAFSKAFPGWMKLIPKLKKLDALQTRIVWTDTFNDRFDDPAYAKAIFNRHIEDVKAALPVDRLLVFDVTQGWQPLCDFLGVPVPDEPFPRVNDSEEFRKRITLFKLLDKAPWILGALGLAIAAWIGLN